MKIQATDLFKGVDAHWYVRLAVDEPDMFPLLFCNAIAPLIKWLEANCHRGHDIGSRTIGFEAKEDALLFYMAWK